MCIHSSEQKYKYGYDKKMSIETFKKIIKEASLHYCPSLTMGGSSEPLLDSQVMEMIHFARGNGFLDIMLNTNATLLTAEISRKLIESGLTRLRIGFDAATGANYEKIRIGADFEKVKNNIVNFMRIREKMNSRLPVVRVSCVHLSANDEEIEEFIRLWEPIVDYVSIQRYKPHEFTKERLQLAPSGKKDVTAQLICSQPFERLYIRGNGDVHACCSVVYGPVAGNISRSSIQDIWNGSKMNALRRALENGNLDKIPVCRNCMLNSYNQLGDD